MAKFIVLTTGEKVKVSEEDYRELTQYRWTRSGIKGNYYAQASVDGKLVYMHRLIMRVTDRKMVVDHKDFDTFNNHRSNLRIATRSQNCGYARVQKQKTMTRFKGISFHKRDRRWQAIVNRVNGRISYKNFATEIEAAKAYDKYAKDYFGEFAVLNFPEQGGHLRGV